MRNFLSFTQAQSSSMTAFALLLTIFLLFVNCRSYSEEKSDARKLVSGGEWIVKDTDYDKAPSDGTTGISPCSVQCIDDESIRSGFNIEINKDTGKERESFCVHNTHPQYGEFVRLKRGEKVRFEYVENSAQEKCINEAMFIKLVPQKK